MGQVPAGLPDGPGIRHRARNGSAPHAHPALTVRSRPSPEVALVPLLAKRGISLSASQVHRLVTGIPERLSLPVLAALCDILECTRPS
jgi:Cro/C1-type HTH DNA-binding domain